MRYLRFLIPLAAFAVLTGFLMKGLWMDPHTVPSPLIDKARSEEHTSELQSPT